ncbi:ARM repeat-containing protein [Mycena olivaceomarginata]|nr:ARM repeat-containing protein [Mycena olivaceomarginata]
MRFTPITLSSLKTMKNTVIGNPDEVFVQTLVQCLNDDPREEDLRIEAAHVIASISYGSEAVLGTLLRCDAPRAFLYAISMLGTDDTAALRAAFARGLRALAIAIADTVGPSQWGLREERASIKKEAEAALDYLFQAESLDLYLPPLVDPSLQTRTSIAQLRGFAARNAEHRTAVSTWLPPEDRLKEVKTKRGWETTIASANARNRQGGWVCRNSQAALWGLATIAKDNSTVAAALVKSPTDRDGPSLLAFALTLAKSRSTETQLAACLCATSIIRATSPSPSTSTSTTHGHPTPHPTNTNTIPAAPSADDTSMSTCTVMNGINRIACFVLYYLVTDHPALAFSAYDRGCLAKLAAVLRDITPIAPRAKWEEEEEEDGVAGLREAALTAIAALSLFDDTIRRSVTDDLPPPAHPCGAGAPRGRAVAVLRTNIVGGGLGMAVFQIFKKEEGVGAGKDREREHKRVTAAALAAVCNIVNEFSPLRPIYLDLGLMPRLVKLLSGGDPTLRLSALWAVKNLLSKTSGETKRDVMQCLGWGRLAELLEDADGAVQEQVFHLVRNLAENEAGIEMIFRELRASVLLRHLTGALSAEDDDVVLQATYVLANLSNGAATYQTHLITSPPLLAALRAALAERRPHVRRPAVSAVLELACASTAARRALGEAGVGAMLRQMCADTGAGAGGFRTITSHSPVGGGGGFQRDGLHMHLGVGGAAGLRGSSMEDDKDVIESAKTALDWLEHGEAYR